MYRKIREGNAHFEVLETAHRPAAVGALVIAHDNVVFTLDGPHGA